MVVKVYGYTAEIREVFGAITEIFGDPVFHAFTDAYFGTEQRIGQAFMNALPAEHYARLTGTVYDPFYYDDPESIWLALDFLTRL